MRPGADDSAKQALMFNDQTARLLPVLVNGAADTQSLLAVIAEERKVHEQHIARAASG